MFLFLRQSRLSAPTRARFDSPGRLALGWAGEINEKPQRGEIPAFKPRSRPRWNLAPLGLGSPLHLRYPGLPRAGRRIFAPFGADCWFGEINRDAFRRTERCSFTQSRLCLAFGRRS